MTHTITEEAVEAARQALISVRYKRAVSMVNGTFKEPIAGVEMMAEDARAALTAAAPLMFPVQGAGDAQHLLRIRDRQIETSRKAWVRAAEQALEVIGPGVSRSDHPAHDLWLRVEMSKLPPVEIVTSDAPSHTPIADEVTAAVERVHRMVAGLHRRAAEVSKFDGLSPETIKNVVDGSMEDARALETLISALNTEAGND